MHVFCCAKAHLSSHLGWMPETHFACGSCKYMASGPSFHLPLRRGAVTQTGFHQHPSRWQETLQRLGERKSFKKKAGCVLPTLEAAAVGGYWLIGDIVGKSSFPGKSESFTSHFSLRGGGVCFCLHPRLSTQSTLQKKVFCMYCLLEKRRAMGPEIGFIEFSQSGCRLGC